MHFVLGFVLGAAASAAAVIAYAPRSGEETRQSIADQLKAAWEEGKQATSQREAELWQEFYQRTQPNTTELAPPTQPTPNLGAQLQPSRQPRPAAPGNGA
ncbi:MAG: YtxH domain-containing protein [Chloroflexaceae bacterium]|nr:YtxH domain-containing protein [Chloroflexaceae bacterium]